ncbi:hypothetical protein [Kitasatospora purpeofusca]|uniref:hypothetical protein n=1 Tax=Kitasatospora purpeofusca TaxID=67352 RepID=UPI0036585A90
MTTPAPEFWVRFGPTGCATGSVRTEYVGLLPDDAHKEFTPRIADRRREAAEGWRHELVDKDRWDAEIAPCLYRRCTHAARTPSS